MLPPAPPRPFAESAAVFRGAEARQRLCAGRRSGRICRCRGRRRGPFWRLQPRGSRDVPLAGNLGFVTARILDHPQSTEVSTGAASGPADGSGPAGVGVGECLRAQVFTIGGGYGVGVRFGVGVDADDERMRVGDNGVHAIGVPLRETVVPVAAGRRRARERSLRGRTVTGPGPLGAGQASYQATEVGRVGADRPAQSDSS